MKKINNTSEIRTNDIIVGIPDSIYVSDKTVVDWIPDERCSRIYLMDEDFESYSEDIIVAKCVFVNRDTNKIYFVDIKNNASFIWDKGEDTNDKLYSIWRF